MLIRSLLCLVCIAPVSSCMLLLTSGHLSHGYYISPSETFRCKLPGGAFSRQLHIRDQRGAVGESVTLKLGSRLLWRVDHLHLEQLGLDGLGRIEGRREQLERGKAGTVGEREGGNSWREGRREQLERGKENYFEHYLVPKLGPARIIWERYARTDETEVLIAHTYLKSDGMEGVRELLFSVDGDYLNVVHYAEDVPGNPENIIIGSLGLYKSCEFE